MRHRWSLLLVLIILIIPTIGMTQTYKELFEKEFLTKPWAGETLEESVCIECHTSDTMKRSLLKIPQEWKTSVHYDNNVSCHNCHGGDPKDATMAMSPERGFVGVPTYVKVPEFCGKCHVGILKNYLESGHGRALKANGGGPNCVLCHGSHAIQKASIDIINEKRCTQCHSYERARTMKQALFLTELKISEISRDLKKLKDAGVYTAEEDRTLFSTAAEFRTLFHSVDVSLIKKRTDYYLNKLQPIEAKIQRMFRELAFRRNFSAFLFLVFLGMAVSLLLLYKTPKK